MKAEKRVRYGQKEKEKLVKMLDDFKKSEEEKEKHDPQPLGMDTTTSKDVNNDDGEMDTSNPKARHSAKSKKNEHGQ